MALKDTLRKLKEETGPSFNKDAVIDVWQKAVAAFIANINEFLSEYTSSGAFLVQPGVVLLSEETLGSYQVSNVALRAGPAVILVQPVGRLILNATGRVDLYRQGRSHERERVIALRNGIPPNPSQSQWVLSVPPQDTSFRIMSIPALSQSLERQQLPLTKENLETALDRLLQ